jgi:hypothetical protein
METAGSGSSPDLGTPPCLVPRIEQTIGGRKYAFFWMQRSKKRIVLYEGRLVEHFADITENEVIEFYPDVEGYLPKMTKAGKVSARQPRIEKETASWWRAQCAFRDLSTGGKIEDLQNRLRGSVAKEMSGRMTELRDRMKREWKQKNTLKIEEQWRARDDSQKAQLWPERFLFETFLDTSEKRKDVIVVRVTDYARGMEKAAPKMGILFEKRAVPASMCPDERSTYCNFDVVLGLDDQAVNAKAAELTREYDEIRQKEKEIRAMEEQAKALEKLAKQKAWENQYSIAMKQAGEQSGCWDVEGVWTISFPVIEEGWGHLHKGETCTLEIHLADDGKHVQMDALFNFMFFKGIMRFVNPTVVAKLEDLDKKAEENTVFRDDEEEEEEEEEYFDPGPGQFLIPETQLPSSKICTFSYSWRGEDVGEGEVQRYEDQCFRPVKFTSPNTLEGTIDVDFIGDQLPFTGIKKKGPVRKQAGQKRKRDAGAKVVTKEWRAKAKARKEKYCCPYHDGGWMI